jgi:hypothetical protein
MGNLVAADRPHLPGFDRDDGGGVPVQRDELDFKRLAVTVNVYHGSDVAGFQAFGGQANLQYDSVMFFDHDSHPSRG